MKQDELKKNEQVELRKKEQDRLKQIKPKVIKYYNNNKDTKTLHEMAEKFEVKYNTFYRWIQGERIKNDETYKKDFQRTELWKKENLDEINVLIEKDILDEFTLKCDGNNISRSEVIRKYIETYIEKKESDFE